MLDNFVIFDIIFHMELCNENIVVLSYNLRKHNDGAGLNRKNRFPRIISRINSCVPDVFGLQECVFIHMLFLKKKFGDKYGVVYRYRNISRKAEACPVFYRLDKYELVKKGTFWISNTPERISKLKEANCYRVCTWVCLKSKETGKEFFYYNLHLDTTPEAIYQGSKIVLEKTGDKQNIIVGGDFNFSPDDIPYRLFGERLVDSCIRQDNLTISTFHGYGKFVNSKEMHIDYLFYSKKSFECYDYFVCNDDEKIFGKGNFASDHYAVVAKLSLR